MDAEQLDVLADLEGFGEDDGQPGKQVAEHPLHGEAEPDARHTEEGDDRRDLNSQLVQRHDYGQGEDQELDGPYDQLADRGIGNALLQPASREPADPAGHQRSNDENDDGAENLKAVQEEEVRDGFPSLVEIHGKDSTR